MREVIRWLLSIAIAGLEKRHPARLGVALVLVEGVEIALAHVAQH